MYVSHCHCQFVNSELYKVCVCRHHPACRHPGIASCVKHNCSQCSKFYSKILFPAYIFVAIQDIQFVQVIHYHGMFVVAALTYTSLNLYLNQTQLDEGKKQCIILQYIYIYKVTGRKHQNRQPNLNFPFCIVGPANHKPL